MKTTTLIDFLKTDMIDLADKVMEKKLTVKKGRKKAYDLYTDYDKSFDTNWGETLAEHEYFIESAMSDLLSMALCKQRIRFKEYAQCAYDRLNMALEELQA